MLPREKCQFSTMQLRKGLSWRSRHDAADARGAPPGRARSNRNSRTAWSAAVMSCRAREGVAFRQSLTSPISLHEQIAQTVPEPCPASCAARGIHARSHVTSTSAQPLPLSAWHSICTLLLLLTGRQVRVSFEGEGHHDHPGRKQRKTRNTGEAGE